MAAPSCSIPTRAAGNQTLMDAGYRAEDDGTRGWFRTGPHETRRETARSGVRAAF